MISLFLVFLSASSGQPICPRLCLRLPSSCLFSKLTRFSRALIAPFQARARSLGPRRSTFLAPSNACKNGSRRYLLRVLLFFTASSYFSPFLYSPLFFILSLFYHVAFICTITMRPSQAPTELTELMTTLQAANNSVGEYIAVRAPVPSRILISSFSFFQSTSTIMEPSATAKR